MSEPTTGPLRWIAGLAAVVLAGLAVMTVMRPAAPSVGPAPPCPGGFVDRTAQAPGMLDRLRAIGLGDTVDGANPDSLRFCYGAIDNPVVSDERVLLLSDAMAEPELLARVGHLLHHIAEGSPFPDAVAADADCDAVVATALAREARAYAAEVHARHQLGVRTSRYDFEPDARAADPEARVALIERYLVEHADGGRNLDPLGAAYRQRCEVERAEARQNQ